MGKATLCRLLACGISVSTAIRGAGISRGSAYGWRIADPAFAADWTEAENEGLDLHEDIIAEAGKTNWRAAEALLRIKRPEVWGRHRHREVFMRGHEAD